MGIEKLTTSLLSEANKEAEEIVRSAEGHVKQMLDAEKQKSTGRISNAKKNVERALKDQRNERLAWARLEAKRLLAEAKEDAIKNSLEDFFQLLKGVRKSPEYKKFLKASVRQAVNDIGATKPVIRVCKGDGKIIGKISGCKIKEDLTGFGGAIVENKDGSMRVNLTLEMLIDSRRDVLRKHIYDGLFKA